MDSLAPVDRRQPAPAQPDRSSATSSLGAVMPIALLRHAAGVTSLDAMPWRHLLGLSPTELLHWRWDTLVPAHERVAVAQGLSRLRAAAGALSDRDRAAADRSTDAEEDEGARLRDLAADLQARNAVLEERLEKLEQRTAAVDAFAAAAAHQLVQPLIIAESSAIIVAEDLGAGADGAVLARLGAIGRSAARARRVIEGLLHEAHTSGRDLELEEVDVRALVEDSLDEHRSRIADRGAAVTVGPLPAVRTEPRLLTVVIDNLVANALRHGPRDGGRIAIRAQRMRKTWRLTVTSDGPPIAAEDAERIFRPFERGAARRGAQGNGLGLAICTRIADRLGGTLGVVPGAAGNTFAFELPAG